MNKYMSLKCQTDYWVSWFTTTKLCQKPHQILIATAKQLNIESTTTAVPSIVNFENFLVYLKGYIFSVSKVRKGVPRNMIIDFIVIFW